MLIRTHWAGRSGGVAVAALQLLAAHLLRPTGNWCWRCRPGGASGLQAVREASVAHAAARSGQEAPGGSRPAWVEGPHRGVVATRHGPARRVAFAESLPDVRYSKGPVLAAVS
jgi:hypothetical protein